MSQAAIGFQWLLRRLGFTGDVYAGEVANGYASLVRPASQLRVANDTLVLYHHGIASELAGALLHLPCRRGVVFHNITPSRFYAGSRLEEALNAGRAQLAAMAHRVDLSLGVSHFNASELRVAEHRNVHTVPLFVEPDRFDADAVDEDFARELHRENSPLVVSVSRLVPHKRVEDLIALHRELDRLSPGARTLIVGPYAKGDRYFKTLDKPAGVTFTGTLTHAELVAAYRSADAFVSMSEHEGFGVPLVESMLMRVPVLAYSATAVPHTLGGAGVQFTEKRLAEVAEAAHLLVTDRALREAVLAGQDRRLPAFAPPAVEGALRGYLDSL